MACNSKDLKGETGRQDPQSDPKALKVTELCFHELLSPSHTPAKHRIQLFRDVVVSVFDFILAEPKDNVRVRFPVWVSWVQVRCLQEPQVGYRGLCNYL